MKVSIKLDDGKLMTTENVCATFEKKKPCVKFNVPREITNEERKEATFLFTALMDTASESLE